MCKCGCNTCEIETKGPLLTEGKVKSLLSEGLQYHIDKKIPLFETVYRIGSDKHLALIKEARKMYSRNVIDLCEDDEALIKTHLGEFGLYEGVAVPLDLPMLNEDEDKLLKIKQELEALRPGTISWIDDIFISSYDGSLQVELDYTLYPDEIKQLAQIATKYGMELKYMTGKNATLVKNKINEDRKYNQEELLRLDLIAHRRFGCDYKNCTDEQKAEVLKDKVKVGVKEALQEDKQDVYDKFLDNPSSPKGRAKSLILKFTKEYGDNASSMAVDRFASKNNLKPEEKYILKYITKNDIKISSQPGGPDFSAVSEAKKKNDPPLNKPKRGGSKAYYVYVRDPKTKKIKKVSFGSGGLRAKIKNPKARKAFAARHNCKNKKDRTKAGYWSCNLPRYAPALGLGAKMNTFW